MKNYTFKIISYLLVCFFLLTGCTDSGLSENFNEEEVKEKAEETIKIINDEDSEALLEMSTIEMKEALNEQVLEDIYLTINQAGEFETIEDISVGVEKDQSSKEEFAVAVVDAKYENKSFTYTISFDKEMKLAGIFYK